MANGLIYYEPYSNSNDKVKNSIIYYLKTATSNCKVVALTYIDSIAIDNICNVCSHQLMCKRQLFNKVN